MDKEVINDRFIEVINTLISEKGVPSKGVIASSLGVSPTKLSEILNKRMNVGTDLAADICDVFDVSAQWLLTGKGEMFYEESKSIEYFLNNNTENIKINSDKESTYYVLYKEEREENKTLLKEIGCLEEKIRQLEADHLNDQSQDAEVVSTKKLRKNNLAATSASAQSKK